MAKAKKAASKRTASKKKAIRIDDTQRTLALRSPSSSVGTMTVHIPDMLMRANRRQYQQCRAYDFQVGFNTTGGTAAREYHIYTLSNAWWVKRSIEMAKGVYMAATKDERALLGDRTAKWNDFVIGISAGAAGNYSDLYQFAPATSGDNVDGAEVASDETLYEDQSKASEVEGDQDLGAEIEYGFTLDATDLTGGVRSYNIFDQFMLTRQHVTPADTRDSPYQDLLSLDQSAMDNLKQDGDNAPWDLDAFPNPFVLADTVTVDAEGSGDNSFSRMITAPLGIVLIKKFGNDGSTEVNFSITEQALLRVRKGTYKGVHAPAYKAMKLS